jgi:DNA-binding MarR family transcriptional regulator
MNSAVKEEYLTLGILEAIEKNEDVTQRNLASDLGISLGLANSYLKRCVRKGLIKMRRAPVNRYLYYLTPKGLSEKSSFSAKYLYTSFEFYRKASNSYS